MSFLSGLHGVIVGLVIYTLLVVDETGIPVPIAPNELLLLFGGVLIRTRVFSAFTFYPLAFLFMASGMLAGYGWSRAAGQPGITMLVRRVHGEAVYARVQARLHAGGSVSVAVARLLPGVRPWATLSCGASGIKLRPFLIGALPALLAWEVFWVTLGVFVGLPAEVFLGKFERLILRGVIMLVLGLLAYVGLRRLSRDRSPNAPRRGPWLLVSVLVAAGGIACVVAGTLAIGRGIVGDDQATWIDALFVALLVVVVAIAVLVRNKTQRLSGPAADRGL